MADIKITTEVAGRVCELLLAQGARVSAGDGIALIEAMKMEIPVDATASGIIKSLLVSVDDMVSEGQTIAVIDG